MKNNIRTIQLTIAAVALLSAFSTGLVAADTIRVCSYNTLFFSQSNEDGRVPLFHQILDSLRPDIMVCQEVDDATLGPRFITDVLTYAPFASSPYIDGPESDNQLLYDQSKFEYIGQRRIPTTLRDIAEFTVVTKPANGVQPDTIVLYSVHLKASDGSTEAAQRASEINALLNTVSGERYALICGDYNIYGPNEAAYKALTGPTATRRFVDPLGSNWARNSASFAAIYTQCTRNVTLGSCGGGVDGGLDDRFDLILVSEALATRVIPESYRPFGNDGVPRLNASIDEPPNALVSASMAAALKCASDHLPLSVDIIVGETPAGIDEVEQPLALSANPSSGRFQIGFLTPGLALRVYDFQGKLVYETLVLNSVEIVNLTDLPTGLYQVRHADRTLRLAIVH